MSPSAVRWDLESLTLVDIAREQSQTKLAGEEPLVCFAGRRVFLCCVFECFCVCVSVCECLLLCVWVFLYLCFCFCLLVFAGEKPLVCFVGWQVFLCWVASVYNKAPSMGLSISLSIWQPLHYQQTNHSQLSSLLCCVESHLLYRIVSTKLWSWSQLAIISQVLTLYSFLFAFLGSLSVSNIYFKSYNNT